MIITEQEIRHEVKSFIGQLIITAVKKDEEEITVKLVTPFGAKEKAVKKSEVKELIKSISKWLT